MPFIKKRQQQAKLNILFKDTYVCSLSDYEKSVSDKNTRGRIEEGCAWGATGPSRVSVTSYYLR